MAWASILNEDDWEPSFMEGSCAGCPLPCTVTYADGTSGVDNSYTWTGTYWEPPDYTTATSTADPNCCYTHPHVPCIRYTGDSSNFVALRVTLAVVSDITPAGGNFAAACAMTLISGSGPFPQINYVLAGEGLSTGSPYLAGHQFIVEFSDDDISLNEALEHITGSIIFSDFDYCGPDNRQLLQIIDVEADTELSGDFWTTFINSRET